jgi:hypothetical protein
MNDSPLLTSLLQVIRDFEIDYQSKLEEANVTIGTLQEENRQLREAAERSQSLLDDIIDEHLRNRLSRLGTPPLDTLVREAGVVLEDRMRRIAREDDNSLTGTALVDAVLAPDKGVLVFSSHAGEQQGIYMLYRGAIQFIRNPPMHNLIEYQASTAQILLRLIDSLLRLLAEAPAGRPEDIRLEDVRRMLKRIPIPEAQRLMYQALYKAGEKGLTGSELSVELNRSRAQMAGVIGALGLRINATEGLENKGGVTTVFEFSRLSSGDYRYKMKPILRKALEMERII